MRRGPVVRLTWADIEEANRLAHLRNDEKMRLGLRCGDGTSIERHVMGLCAERAAEIYFDVVFPERREISLKGDRGIDGYLFGYPIGVKCSQRYQHQAFVALSQWPSSVYAYAWFRRLAPLELEFAGWLTAVWFGRQSRRVDLRLGPALAMDMDALDDPSTMRSTLERCRAGTMKEDT